MKWQTLILAGIIFCTCTSIQKQTSDKETWIKPWKDNPYYWQYKGQPVLLLGGTDNDNIFQNNNLESHLDSLQGAGGNYIRNVMSDRDPGNQRAFAIIASGKYNLDKWNDGYWLRFENMLKLTSERDIIVQIEVWDRFDHSSDQWLADPYNPHNNINYTYVEARLDSLYPSQAYLNKQPFFFTVPELDNNETLLHYQKAFVKKLLSISVKYNNVLYCIDNETSGAEAWSTFWAGFIRENSEGKDIYITQMWDKWNVKSEMHKRTLDHPERYGYIDISQNSQITGRHNWDNAQYVFDYIKENPRPVNSAKIYGNDQGEWLNRGINTEHAIHTFCRNIIGGFASSRFHRPPSGLGLSPPSINCIRTIRKIEKLVKMWEITPRMDLLKDADDNEAYLAAKEGETYVIFFPKGGNVKLDLSNYHVAFNVRWITVADAKWGVRGTIQGGGSIGIEPDGEASCFAVIMKK